jgi:23S rRNA (uridine2552-2'-O)-methyltransferase
MGKFVAKDSFYEKAKKEGYRARSAYKLIEIQRRFQAIKNGDRVLDLGAAPGGWLQVISKETGAKGLVIGIDLAPVAPLNQGNVVTITSDIRGISIEDLLAQAATPAFDVITCDIAPNLSGIKDVDGARIGELYDSVLCIVREGLKQGGGFIIKSFFGPDFKKRVEEQKSMFSRVTVYKPDASRGVSSEIYLVSLGKKRPRDTGSGGLS